MSQLKRYEIGKFTDELLLKINNYIYKQKIKDTLGLQKRHIDDKLFLDIYNEELYNIGEKFGKEVKIKGIRKVMEEE